jgi:hypothetical protein
MKKAGFGLINIRRVPNAVWMLVATLSFLGLFTPNSSLTIAAAVLLAWFFLLLWRPGEPPILLLALGYQWLQVVTKVLNADVLRLPVQELNIYQGNVEKAIWLSMTALAVLALGMRLALGHYKSSNADLARNEAMLFSPNRLWLFYLASLMLSVVILSLARVAPGITQIAIALANIKWAVFFMLAYVCFLRPERLYLLLMAFGIELALGFGAYFSSFKTVFFITILAFVGAGRRLSGKQIAIVLPLASVLFVMSLAWTAIKIDYRDYLSGGQSAQIVTRGYVERIQKLFDMVSALEKEDMGNALQDMADRLSYVDFFGRVLVMVPSRIRHEEGALWGGALRHIFMPRLLFPDKPTLRDDSDITNYYTGLKMSGEEQGTSVSIGYVAESYIDFGGFWMFALILALGYLWGRMYRFFLTRPRIPLIVGYGLAVVVLLGAMLFETTNVKLLGGVVTTFLVAYVVQKFFARKLVRKLMFKRRRQTSPPSLPHGMPRQG